MALNENKDLIRRYIQAIDDNATSDWSVLDDYIPLSPASASTVRE